MADEDAERLLLKLLELAERMERRDARVFELLAQQAAALQAAARAMEGGGERLARSVLATLRDGSREAVQAGVDEAAHQCCARLRQAADEAARATEALRRQHGLWGWALPLGLIVGSVLATGAAGYAVVGSREEVARHRIEAALLRAYNQADVTLCDGRLCANVDERGGRHGDRGQYRLVEPRPPSP